MLVACDDDAGTDATLAAVQADGHVLSERHDVARPPLHPPLGLQLADDAEDVDRSVEALARAARGAPVARRRRDSGSDRRSAALVAIAAPAPPRPPYS